MRMSWATLKPGDEGYDAIDEAMRDIARANEEAAKCSRLADECKRSAKMLASATSPEMVKSRVALLKDVAFCENAAREWKKLSVEYGEQLSRLMKR
jgi:hypothetical protein